MRVSITLCATIQYAIWQLLHCRAGTNKLMSFVVNLLSNDATCIACIIGQVLLEPFTLFTSVYYKHTCYYNSLATAVLQVQEYLHASHDFGILCKMLVLKMIPPCILQGMNGTNVSCLVVIIMWSLHVGQVPMLVYIYI